MHGFTVAASIPGSQPTRPNRGRNVQQRWVRNNGIINSAGVSAGIDMALQLVAELTNEATARRVQLALHYDPDPPFGGIHYKQLPPLMRTVRALITLTVPAYTR